MLLPLFQVQQAIGFNTGNKVNFLPSLQGLPQVSSLCLKKSICNMYAYDQICAGDGIRHIAMADIVAMCCTFLAVEIPTTSVRMLNDLARPNCNGTAITDVKDMTDYQEML